jgi:hypothetical protein
MKPKDKPHYVNNAEFSAAVTEYVTRVNDSKKQNDPVPVVPDYIARCFLKISEGLSHKANFVRYTYREEMVMDAVENCLKAIENYNLETATRTGKPNAFAYFTQIAWYAFLRRIQKEKKQQDIKLKFLAENGMDDFFTEEFMNNEGAVQTQAYVEELRRRIDYVKDKDSAFDSYRKKEKDFRKRTRRVDSDLSEFMVD